MSDYLDPAFQQQMNADLESVFFRLDGFAESVQIVDSEATLAILWEQDVEVMDEAGTLDVVAYAISVQCGLVQREETVFVRNGRRWKVGRILETSPDGEVETWEVSPSVI